jgi:hypothetical protein
MPISNKIQNLKLAIRDFLLGATNIYDMILYLERKKICTEYMIMLITMGDMLGYPISSYYRLKLFPYYIPKLHSWKKYFLKERDIIEKLE